MKLKRCSIYEKYLADMILNQGFKIQKNDRYAPVNLDSLVNHQSFTDCEFRCDCGAFIGRDIIGQVCPRCHSEIVLHSLNFRYTGWIDLGEHCVITPSFFTVLKRVLGPNMLRFILGDYKEDVVRKYSDNDPEFYENKKNKKKPGRASDKDIVSIRKKIPNSKLCFQGLGHDVFRDRFYEVVEACAPSKHPDLPILMDPANFDKIFTNKIPLYSTAFRPISKTSETMFYPKVNKSFSSIVSIASRLDDMILPEEKIQALNFIQNYYMETVDHIIRNDISKKTGFVRSEIVGGTFSFSARSVITLDISLNVDEVDLPYPMVLTGYKYRITHLMAVRHNMTLEQAYLLVNTYEDSPYVKEILDEIIAEGQWIAILREPANNLASMECCKIRSYKMNDDTISLPPEVLEGFNADFDGDQLDLCFLPKELVPEFKPFHYSCMADYVNNRVKINWKEWCDITLGRMSD